MQVLLDLMKDPSVVVRDSVAWTLSRICEQVPEAAFKGANLDNLLNALMENLDSEPRVATNVCWVRENTVFISDIKGNFQFFSNE